MSIYGEIYYDIKAILNLLMIPAGLVIYGLVLWLWGGFLILCTKALWKWLTRWVDSK